MLDRPIMWSWTTLEDSRVREYLIKFNDIIRYHNKLCYPYFPYFEKSIKRQVFL